MRNSKKMTEKMTLNCEEFELKKNTLVYDSMVTNWKHSNPFPQKRLECTVLILLLLIENTLQPPPHPPHPPFLPVRAMGQLGEVVHTTGIFPLSIQLRTQHGPESMNWGEGVVIHSVSNVISEEKNIAFCVTLLK